MKCPIDGSTLVIADRSGVEIDYCPQCRGVWLDRGELDKIIERSGAAVAQMSARPAPQAQPAQQAYQAGYDEPRGKAPKKKRGGFDFLEDIFDF